MLRALRAFFAEPGRQAFGWSSLGMAGFGLAAIGILLMNRGGDGMQQAQAVAGTTVVATATPTMTPTTAPTFTPTATVTPSPSPTATPTAAAIRHDEPAQISQPEVAEPTPEATPTPPPVVAGGPYCPSISSTMPPNSVFGVFTIGGEPAPAGTSVSLAFDGVIGPTAATTDTGGYRVDYGAAGSDCANRVGAAIAVVYDGQFFATGHTVGDSPGSPVVLDVDAP